MALDDNLLLEEFDDEKTIEFIKNYLPQELKEKFSDDELYYFLDLIYEYYSEKNVQEEQADKDGYVEVQLDPIINYIIAEAKKDEMGEYEYDDIIFIVQGEFEYALSLESEEND